MPASFVNDTLWPEFEQISSALRAYVDGITERILADVLHGDSSEAQEVGTQKPTGASRGRG